MEVGFLIISRYGNENFPGVIHFAVLDAQFHEGLGQLGLYSKDYRVILQLSAPKVQATV